MKLSGVLLFLLATAAAQEQDAAALKEADAKGDDAGNAVASTTTGNGTQGPTKDPNTTKHPKHPKHPSGTTKLPSGPSETPPDGPVANRTTNPNPGSEKPQGSDAPKADPNTPKKGDNGATSTTGQEIIIVTTILLIHLLFKVFSG